MSTSLEDIDFDKLKKKFHFLMNLPLKELYELFSTYGSFPSNGDFLCKGLPNINAPNTCNVLSPCISVQNVLPKLNRMFPDKQIDNKIKVCEHLNYWIYDNIKNIADCKEVENFYNKLNTMKSSFLTDIHNCEIKNFAISKDQFIIKEKLFLHAEILHWIKEETKFIYPNEHNLYNEYIDECVNFYKAHICKNISTIQEEHTKELAIFKSNFESAVSFLGEKGVSINQGKLECQTVLQNQQARERSAKEGKQQEGGPEELAEDGQRGAAGPSERVEELRGPPGPEMPLPVVGNNPTDQVTTDTAVSGDLLKPSITGKVGTIGTTLAGSSLFLVMMYKYTPFGSWINTRVLKKDKLMENMNKNNYELLLNDVGNDKTSLNDPMYHIRYNSLTNQ
ncbi:variable surface protein Vir24 [Plasmodium vivax India VII]|uniref:Variable surface protein Vir24-related n=2 Tax=Plasmodium vivax TaxID=5855 RepID=A5KCL1_PLAVS|nr:variable surface protein Vir24-related [Plasmodium vivax]EDL42952.1 variable surface protein Vir24-related [Plasmodium vivax]KMZ83041.1 variable surface protein Vir24 [Plasmodium vivax India VII]|eukprot:XP_001608614.1 variable surface protein Vir24-related [Plasmodium vivax Sal-1]